MGVNRCVNSLISGLRASRAVLSPGSRNAPILNAISNSNLAITSVVDERSAAFVALGMAKHLNAPVILNCTSGTAALNYYPAIAEAFYARVPLIVITADRPPEQIDAWDGQAIRQTNVFASHIRGSFETPTDYNNIEEFKGIASQVNACLETGIPGPVHINVPIREPFYADMNSEPVVVQSAENKHSKPISLIQLQRVINESFLNKRIMVFNGMASGEQIQLNVDGFHEQVIELSDVTSNIPSDIPLWDAFLFNQISPAFTSCVNLKPHILITTGTTTVSKGLKLFLRKHAPDVHYHISNFNEIGPMFGTKPIWVNASESNLVPENQKLAKAESGKFQRDWMAKTHGFRQKFNSLKWDEWNEFSAMKSVLEQLPDGVTVHIANSMVIRYASYFKEIIDRKQMKIRSNRGTSGIDGCTSTAVGEALSTEGTVYLITGDIAFLYDVNALWNNPLPKALKIVVLNNSGGGIFELIQGPEKMGDSAILQTTNHKQSIKRIAKAYQIDYLKVNGFDGFLEAVQSLVDSPDICILEIKTKRKINNAFYSKFRKLN